MGKRDKRKKKQEKEGTVKTAKASGETKAQKKQDKKDKKKLKESGEQDIEEILQSIIDQEKSKSAVSEKTISRPPPRVNFSLVLAPNKSGGEGEDLILFGGEFFNGVTTKFYNELYRYNIEKNEWKMYSSPTAPPPRSSHQAVVYKEWLYLVGGEFASPSQNQFYHYRDMWRLDLNTNEWDKIDIRKGPTARSGHRMVVWKSMLVLFGGFFDTVRETKYHNDTWVMDLAAELPEWKRLEYNDVNAPSPRSGFQMFVAGDQVMVYGGYCKQVAKKNAPKDQEELAARGVVHTDLWALNMNNLKWDRVKKSGFAPHPCSGSSLAVRNKKQAILFGGVYDEETDEGMESTFYNDLYAFDLERRRWYPLGLRAPLKKRKRRRKDKDDEPAAKEANTTNTLDDDDDIDWELAEIEEGGGLALGDNADAELDDEPEPEPEAPQPRINSGLIVRGNMLYVYGGLLEKGDKEVTLDDLWALDLNKMDQWKLILPVSGSQEWVEDESDKDSGSDSEGSDDDDGDSDDDDDSDGEGGEGDEEDLEAQKKKARETRAATRRSRAQMLREALQEEEAERTPRVGEKMNEFFVRSKLYWSKVHYEQTQVFHDEKTLRREAFRLARERWLEMLPVLKEIEAIDQAIKADEAASEDVKQERKGKTRR